MKIKNIKVGDYIESKNIHGGDKVYPILKTGEKYKVLEIDEDMHELPIMIAVPGHKTFGDGFWVHPKNFRKPKLKTLDQSVFDGLDEKWRFAAIVADGRALYFNKKPCGSDDITGHFVFKGDYQASFCGNDYDTTNWKNSLIERESSACEEADFLNDTISNIFDEIIDIEYFYSKITCELLEKGSSYVLAYVSGKSEQTAIENKEVAVIESMDVLFKDTNDYDWKYAVSINQQTGEPLTAKEVGL